MMYTEKKESANSAKREYVKPFAEVMKLEAFNSLLVSFDERVGDDDVVRFAQALRSIAR